MKCVFCEIVAGREPASIIYSDAHVVALMTLRPTQPGECMIIPKQHIDHFTDLPDDLAIQVVVVAQKIGRKMRQVFSPKRVGMVVHGFGVPHAHLLLVAQHNPHDITSGRFARVVDGKVVFDQTAIPVPSREELDKHASLLRLEEPEPNQSPEPTAPSGHGSP
jgi:histidine triad (HIT) family protein